MPIYEFDCQDCGGSFDELVRNAAAVSAVTCPTCTSSHVKKKLSLFSSRGGSSNAIGSAANCAPTGL